MIPLMRVILFMHTVFCAFASGSSTTGVLTPTATLQATSPQDGTSNLCTSSDTIDLSTTSSNLGVTSVSCDQVVKSRSVTQDTVTAAHPDASDSLVIASANSQNTSTPNTLTSISTAIMAGGLRPSSGQSAPMSAPSGVPTETSITSITSAVQVDATMVTATSTPPSAFDLGGSQALPGSRVLQTLPLNVTSMSPESISSSAGSTAASSATSLLDTALTPSSSQVISGMPSVTSLSKSMWYDITRSDSLPSPTVVSTSTRTRTVNKKWIAAVAVLAFLVALLLFVIATWWLRRRRLGFVDDADMLNDDDLTVRNSVVSTTPGPEPHSQPKSPSIMCAGDRDSYPPFAEFPLHIPLYADIGLAEHPASIGNADLATTQNRVTSRLRRISNHSIWEVQGSATAVVLAENRLSAISPVSRSSLSPSPTMLFWTEQTAGNECRDETAPVTTAASWRASNNPFRSSNKPKSSANLEYQSEPMLALPDPVLLATRQASRNPFRQLNRPWVDIPSSLQPSNGGQPITTPPYVYREVLHSVAHEGHPSGSSNPEAMPMWQPSQLSGFEIAYLREPPTSSAAAWSTESPMLANLNRTWPAAMPQAPGSHHGPVNWAEQPYVPSREPSPTPEPGAVFFTAI